MNKAEHKKIVNEILEENYEKNKKLFEEIEELHEELEEVREKAMKYDELLEDFYEERRKVKELQAINAQLQQRKEALEFIVERQERTLYAFTDRRKEE
jgi:predicted RecB family endonuclease